MQVSASLLKGESMKSGQTKQNKKSEQTSFSSIAAFVYISESELARAYVDYDSKWESEQPEAFKDILKSIGLNTDQPYKRYDAITHKNRMGEVVTCSRWVGNERHDKAWINSGYASREALDRDKNSRMLDCLYEQRGLTTNIIDAQELKDMYEEKKGEE